MADKKRTYESDSMQISALKLRTTKDEPVSMGESQETNRISRRKAGKVSITRDLILRVIAGLKEE